MTACGARWCKIRLTSTACQQRPARNQMSDIPPAPPKSPILIIVLLAVVGAVLAAIGFIWTSRSATTDRQAAALAWGN